MTGQYHCYVRRVSGRIHGDWFLAAWRDQDSGTSLEMTRIQAEELARLHRADGFDAEVRPADVS